MAEWRDIKGFDGYQCSNEGEVRSLDRVVCGGQNKKGKILKLMNNKNGYLMVCLYKNGSRKYYLVHRIIAKTFIQNPNNLPCVNHKDECKKNNFVYINEDGSIDLDKSNLEWCDAKYNCNYGTRNKKISKTRRTVSVIQKTKDGIALNEYLSITEAATKTNISRKHISACVNGKRKTAGGYIWMKKTYQQAS